MSMEQRAAFAAELRRRRDDVGRSLADVAGAAHIDRSYLSHVEHGRRWPSESVATALDEALSAGGALAGAWRNAERPPEQRDTDVWERLTHVLDRPERVDRAVVDHLAVVLDAQRRLEDAVGARRVLPFTLTQLATIDELTRAARSDVRGELLSVAAQWRQFAAWQSQDLGRPQDALAHHDRALEAAQEIDDDNMVVTVLSLKSHLAWSQRDPGRAVGLAAAGRRRPGRATPGVLALIAQQQARGHALDGAADPARRLLDDAEALAAVGTRQPDDEPPWIYFADAGRLLFQRGLVELELGENARAVELFTDARDALPASYRRDRARYIANLALATARDGDVEKATSDGREALDLARETGSSHALSDVRTMRAALDAHADHPSVRSFDDYISDLF